MSTHIDTATKLYLGQWVLGRLTRLSDSEDTVELPSGEQRRSYTSRKDRVVRGIMIRQGQPRKLEQLPLFSSYNLPRN